VEGAVALVPRDPSKLATAAAAFPCPEPRGGRRGSRNGDAGAARPLMAPTRRSPRLAGRDPEHPIVMDGADKVGDCSLLEYSSSIRGLRNVLFANLGSCEV
jgi:hypothetical protein